jgi:uncharacterized membrane protein YphA (DoxX/SURF4 family)
MSDIAHGGYSGGSVRQWTLAGNPAYQAYQILHVAFVVAPILAGLDKFMHILVNWDQYVAPITSRLVGGHTHGFMLAVGVVEIVAGIGVALKPRIFAYVVAAWLLGIIANLLLVPGYFDIALRDLGLCLGALALGRLSQEYDHRFEHR